VFILSKIKRGDFVSWDSAGGRARGRVVKVITNGNIDGIPVKITGTEEEPAAKIRLYKKINDKWEETDKYVGHKVKTLRKIKPISKSSSRLKRIAELEVEEELKLKVKKQEEDGTYYITPSNIKVPPNESADSVIAQQLDLTVKEYQDYLIDENGAFMTEWGVNFDAKEQAEEAIKSFYVFYTKDETVEKNKGRIVHTFQKQAQEKKTDFPTKGENQKISLKNSQFPQFDWEYAAKLKEEYPEIWKKGGNIRGNEAYNHWTKARNGKFSPATLDWIKEREAWMARHEGDFRVAGVVAVIKWGGICSKGMSYMKKLINDEKKKINERKRV
jgi:hypothetical protein